MIDPLPFADGRGGVEKFKMKEIDKPNIIVNHTGFFTQGSKRAVFPATAQEEFELQDMMQNDAEAPLGAFENWKTVFRGRLEACAPAFGEYRTGDFSDWTTPGIYRLVLPEGGGRSLIFAIHDGILSDVPRLFLDYLHANRCGVFENDWRGPCHLDDGRLRASGKLIDATGGWHDAGDTRKWMAHCTLPAWAMAVYKERHGRGWDHWQEDPWRDDLLAEIAWGVSFIPKMQDPSSGMIYSDVGGGGDSRKREGMNWWVENLSGCYADNADNRFTDNIPGSGDERNIREEYNAVVQYSNISILHQTARLLEQGDPALAEDARRVAAACWRFMEGRLEDTYHGWTSVRAWRLLAALACDAGPVIVEEALGRLLELRAPSIGFWFMDSRKRDFYRGALQSAQPLIALAAFAEKFPSHPRRREVRDAVVECLERYVEPLRRTNPFGIVPYGLYMRPATEGDRYREWSDGHCYRFFMPDCSKQKLNSGLAGHWTSWAHALAWCGEVFDLPEFRTGALDQLHWLLGNNPVQASFLSGIGYNHPMPHSRAFGYLNGGLMNGPRGNAKDEMFVDLGAHGDWSTCEYWNAPLANALFALSYLLPKHREPRGKIGTRTQAHGDPGSVD
ncbi:MAG: glycoside hydrolase family 9 protein [Terrimicrobiaceae bacterium]|nr:glycoside hydrolase family 9 protein [Terrimicrobiaceae bacterium]